jgi:UDP:flavonoid glycosyltransferase YjiC (YdhE family)
VRITVFAGGSRGDIQPCIVLCKGLQQRGYRVYLAAPEDFAGFAESENVKFHPLRGDVQKIMASETGRAFMEQGGSNPLKSIRAMRKMIGPVMGTMADDAFAACRGADAMICLGVFGAFGHTIATALQIPIINIEPTPLLPTRAFPAPSWPLQANLGGWHNYLSGRAMLEVIWLWYRPHLNAFRRRLGLSPYTSADFYRTLRSTPLLGAYSPRIIPHPPDWPESVNVSGYLFLDTDTGWRPSQELTAFLDSGDAPVYVGFGSMGSRDAGEIARLVIAALVGSGQRGILATGWGGLSPESVPEQVFVLDSAPHSWLFPRMAAVVHHGGAGTTAEGVRAGVPSVIVPFILDQAFWGARVKALGLGPDPVPRKKLTVERLAHAIQRAVSDTGIRERAAACGDAVRLESGLSTAVDFVAAHLGEPG